MKTIIVVKLIWVMCFLVVLTFVSIPHKSLADDHGNSLESATLLTGVMLEPAEEGEKQYVGGVVNTLHDNDFFMVNISDASFLNVWLFNTDTLEIQLMDALGKSLLLTQALSGKYDEHDGSQYDRKPIKGFGVSPGRYYLRVGVADHFPVYYSIAVQAQKWVEDDHDNALSGATPAQSLGFYNGFSGCLETMTDVDSFRFSLDEFSFSCSNRDNFDFIEYNLYDNQENPIDSGKLTDFNTVEMNLTSNEYFISLKSTNEKSGCYSVCTAYTTFLVPGGMASGVVFPPDAHAKIELVGKGDFSQGVIYSTDTAEWGDSGAWWMMCSNGVYDLTVTAEGYEETVKEVYVDYGVETQTGSIVLTPLQRVDCQGKTRTAIKDNLDITFPCLIVGEDGYGVTLKNITDSFDFTSFAWMLEIPSLTHVCSGCNVISCINLTADFRISVPCADFQGRAYGFDLIFKGNSCGDGALCWELDPTSFRALN